MDRKTLIEELDQWVAVYEVGDTRREAKTADFLVQCKAALQESPPPDSSIADRIIRNSSVYRVALLTAKGVLDRNDYRNVGAVLEDLREALDEPSRQPATVEPGELVLGWTCPVCHRALEPREVTYDERHDPRVGGCGAYVDDAITVKPPSAGGGSDAEV